VDFAQRQDRRIIELEKQNEELRRLLPFGMDEGER
jgi:Fe2+ transport system protein FeoA